VAALPLRLRRELGHQVSVVAVTQGSRADRQAARLEEMRGACGFLGFEVITTRPNGLTAITPRTRQENPEAWAEAVGVVADILSYHRPQVVFMPHEDDFHPTHIGTHHLVADALRGQGPDFHCRVVETEFWRALAEPNLMVESTPEDVGDLVVAVSFHRGEVARNPYHLSLPPLLADNVRRGSELVGGMGSGVPAFRFATLYRVRDWVQGAFRTCLKTGLLAPANGDLGMLFPR
jgi:LmbE family N-acetylglucosaminyl deacetylase